MRKIIILMSFFAAFSIYGIDFKTDFSFNNFNFNSNNEINPSTYYFEYSEIVTQEIAEGVVLDAGFQKKVISDYSIFTDLRIDNDLFGFNIGIFSNFLNDSSKMLTPGINYGIDFKVPGITIVHLKLNNTIPNTSPLEEGVDISNYDIRIGFYLNEAIISANLVSENTTKGDILTSTLLSSNKYFINLDLFNKYSKYRISLDVGWNMISKKETALTTSGATLSGTTVSDSVAGSVYFDTDVTLLVKDHLDINLGVLFHMIKLPIKNVDSFPSDKFNWGCSIGFTLKF